jgi:hypothetical protein
LSSIHEFYCEINNLNAPGARNALFGLYITSGENNIMGQEETRRQYIEEINAMRSSLGLDKYDDNYMNSASLEELQKLYARNAAYMKPVKRPKKPIRRLLIVAALAAICISAALLAFLTFAWNPPAKAGASGTPQGGGVNVPQNIPACICDAKPGICEDSRCYCDPLCANVTG